MIYTLERQGVHRGCTQGDLYNKDGWICHTLEDEVRKFKIANETAIPAGIYQIKIRPIGESRLDASYEKRFDFYQGQLWLQDVPNFTYVYIHCGNIADHTSGCPLIGMVRYENAIGKSRTAYRKLYPMMLEDIKNEKTYLEIIDSEIL